MKTETLILLFEIDYFDRKEAELVENNNCNSEQLAAIIDMAKEKATTILIYSLTDFMDLCNNQEFQIESYWVSYVNYTKTIKSN